MIARIALALALLAAPLAAAAQPGALYLVSSYDPARDSAADVQLAVTRAQAENKRILLIVGGDWCSWCHILDHYLMTNAEPRAAMAASFVIVKIDMSREHPNEEFLSRYPTAEGYPDFIVLESDGAYLASQDTAVLEHGRSYDSERVIAFARRWRR